MLENPRHEQFAQRVAAGGNAARAYVAAGYSARGAAQSALRLLKYAHIRARVAEIKKEITARLTECSIREVGERLKALESRWLAMQRVIAERAAAPEMQAASGGTTGLLVRTLKSLGSGDALRIVEEYAVDTGLLRELREHERQAAQELGQWTEKHEHSGADGGPIAVTDPRLQSLSDEELGSLAATLRKLAAAGNG